MVKNKTTLRVVEASKRWNEKLGGLAYDLQKLSY